MALQARGSSPQTQQQETRPRIRRSIQNLFLPHSASFHLLCAEAIPGQRASRFPRNPGCSVRGENPAQFPAVLPGFCGGPSVPSIPFPLRVRDWPSRFSERCCCRLCPLFCPRSVPIFIAFPHSSLPSTAGWGQEHFPLAPRGPFSTRRYCYALSANAFVGEYGSKKGHSNSTQLKFSRMHGLQHIPG